MQVKNGSINLRRINTATLGALLILLLQVNSVHAQGNLSPQVSTPKSYPVVSQETYSRVLDILFPRGAPTPSNTVWVVILRFLPSFKSESQVVIRRDVDKFQVIEYASPDGNIYGRLNEVLAHGGKEDAVEMAKMIRVNRRVVSVSPAQVKRWHTTLFDSIPGASKTLREVGEEFDKTGSESLVLDGSVYELWYEQGLNKMTYSLYDVEVDKPGSDGEFRLVQWMNSVRREVGRVR